MLFFKCLPCLAILNRHMWFGNWVIFKLTLLLLIKLKTKLLDATIASIAIYT